MSTVPGLSEASLAILIYDLQREILPDGAMEQEAAFYAATQLMLMGKEDASGAAAEPAAAPQFTLSFVLTVARLIVEGAIVAARDRSVSANIVITLQDVVNALENDPELKNLVDRARGH